MEYCLKNDISIDALYLATTLSYGMARRLNKENLNVLFLIMLILLYTVYIITVGKFTVLE